MTATAEPEDAARLGDARRTGTASVSAVSQTEGILQLCAPNRNQRLLAHAAAAN